MKKRHFFILFISICAGLGLGFRLIFASMGNNPDMESWWIIANIVKNGKLVYLTTDRYNYGPIWAYILGFLGYLSAKLQVFHIGYFHLVISFFLGLVDLCIAYILYKFYDKKAGLIFMLNPVSILLTGFHTQFDNFAVLLGFISWIYYLRAEKENYNLKNLLLSSIFLGLSLSTKHILIFFPLWILLINNNSTKILIKKGIYILISYAIFFSGFAIELFRAGIQTPQMLVGLQNNIFGYKGSYGISFITKFIDLFFPSIYIEKYFNSIPLFKGYMFLFLLLVSIAGFIFIRIRKPETKYIYPFYLLVFFTLSISMADQYIATALPAIAIFSNNIFAIVFFGLTFAYLSYGFSANISNFQNLSEHLVVFNLKYSFWPWNATAKIENISTQAWSFLLILAILFNKIKSVYTVKNSKLIIIFLVFCMLQLALYSYVKMTPPKKHFIKIIGATYGKNCNAKNNNVLTNAKKICDNKIICSFNLNLVDFKPGCAKDYTIEWTCDVNDKIHSTYFINYKKEANGTLINIYCPAEQYSGILNRSEF